MRSISGEHLLEARKNHSANEDAEYWLEHVKAFAGDHAPVIIACNKSEQMLVDLDDGKLRKKYPGLQREVHHLSCAAFAEEELDPPMLPADRVEYQDNHELFIRRLAARVKELSERQDRLTDVHFSVMDELVQLASKNSCITKQDYLDLCEQQGMRADDSFGEHEFLKFLDRLGLVVHFPELVHNRQKLILNPRWLTWGVYTLLYSTRIKRDGGRVCFEQVERELTQNEVTDEYGKRLSYTEDQIGLLLEVMERFNVAYPVAKKQGEWIIPELLPEKTPEALDFPEHDCLRIDFQFGGFLPRHIMPGLIVNYHGSIRDDLAWRTGVAIHSADRQAEALLQAEYRERRLVIKVRGKGAGDFSVVLREHVRTLLKEMKDISYSEMVWLPESARVPDSELTQDLADGAEPRVNLATLLANIRAGREIYTCEFGSFSIVEVLKVMAIKDAKVAGDTYNQTINIEQNNGGVVAPNRGNARDVSFQVTVNHDRRQQVIHNLNQLDAQLADLIQQAVQSVTTQPQEAVQVMQALQPAREAIATLQSPDKSEADKQQAKGIIEGLWDGSGQVISGLAKGLDTVAKTGKAVVDLNGLAEKITPFLYLLVGAGVS